MQIPSELPNCSLCLDAISPEKKESNTALTTVPLSAALICGHIFHDECIKKWFATLNKNQEPHCPLCRTVVPKNNTSKQLTSTIHDLAFSNLQSNVRGEIVQSPEGDFDFRFSSPNPVPFLPQVHPQDLILDTLYQEGIINADGTVPIQLPHLPVLEEVHLTGGSIPIYLTDSL